MDKTKLSLALELLEITWVGVHSSTAMWSWARLNRCMQNALHLAIEAGLEFGLHDFAYISNNFNWAWWAGDGEGFYCHAVVENNRSAIKAYEYHHNRKPFIVNDVVQSWGSGCTVRGRGRLAVGSGFVWQGERVIVTSFDDKENKIIACSYKPREHNEQGYICEPLKVKHIYKITHEDLRRMGGQCPSQATE